VRRGLGETGVNGLVEFVKALGAARLAAMAAVTVALVGFFVVVGMRVSAPSMAPLFTELSLEDSSRVVQELESQGIPYELRGDGSTILIPKDNVTRARMRLAESGLPRGGAVGYEIFDKSDTLGTTSFVQNVNHLRALEGELARTIRSLDRVAAARVHLVIPERQLFQRDRQDPSASIVLRVKSQLEQQQVRAIRHLVATAVRGLKPERVSIVDEQGRLLADGVGAQAGMSPLMDERNFSYEQRVKQQLESVVSSIVGPGRARVTVTAEMDYTRVQQTSDRYDPESRVVRSTQSREEQAQSDQAAQDGGVSVGNQLPGGGGTAANAQQQQPNGNRDSNRKSEETVNYEISRTTRTEVTEPGRVKRLSVAVLVDGNYTKGQNNDVTYAPRPQEEIDRITALVRSAVGFDEARGDRVEVVNLRFAEVAGTPQIAGEGGGFMDMLRFTTDDIMHAINLAVVAILSLLVLLFVVRPLVRRVVTPDEGATPALPPAFAEAALAQVQGAGTATGGLPVVPGTPLAPLTRPENLTTRQIDFAQLQGEVHQQSIQKVGDLASRNPYETVSILRQWMHEKNA
jgi:flagellar M-ring protein FliF